MTAEEVNSISTLRRMPLYLVLLSFVVAFSLASTEQCVSSAGSSIDLSLHSLKNASGHWVIKVDTRRFTMKENPRELTVNVHQETRLCDNNEIEQLFSVAFVYPSLHGTSMPGAIEPSITSTTTSTAPTPTTTTTSASRPKSCPHSEYQLFPELNCYKAFPSFSKRRSWSDARELCRSDGGDLMLIETERERKDVYIPLYNSLSYHRPLWVGVHIPDGEDGWMTVKGEPALSTWWENGYTLKDAAYTCAFAEPSGLLGNYDCEYRRSFICEIPL